MKLTFFSIVATLTLLAQGGYAVPDPIIHCKSYYISIQLEERC